MRIKFFQVRMVLSALCFFIYTGEPSAQTVYLPLSHPVEGFLDRMASKGLLVFHDEVRPITRNQSAELLMNLALKTQYMSDLEKQEYDWLKSDLVAEKEMSAEERWYPYKYRDSLFKLTLSPMAGYEISNVGNYSARHRWWGIKVWGTYSDCFGASFEYRDNTEFGNGADRKKNFSPKSGYFISSEMDNAFDYSDVRGSMSYSWKWGSVSIIKDYMKWGHGERGQLILSNKAPSFTHVRLCLQPKEWFRFYYFQGWLNSQVWDSSAFQYNNTTQAEPYLRRKLMDKYIVANMLSVSPLQWLDVSVGNSYVYGGALRWETLIPFNYYKAMDHNSGHAEIDDGNGLLFWDLQARYPRDWKIYGTLLIDVLSVREILKGEGWTSWMGFTLGAKRFNFPSENIDVQIEYTRLSPWIYENKDEVASYKHMNYVLGHWIGQNADELSLIINYKPIRALNLTLTFERVRKGGLDDLSFAYQNRQKRNFLYGQLRKEFYAEVSVAYEPIRDCYLNAVLRMQNLSDDDKTRTPEWLQDVKKIISFSLSYGLY